MHKLSLEAAKLLGDSLEDNINENVRAGAEACHMDVDDYMEVLGLFKDMFIKPDEALARFTEAMELGKDNANIKALILYFQYQNIDVNTALARIASFPNEKRTHKFFTKLASGLEKMSAAAAELLENQSQAAVKQKIQEQAKACMIDYEGYIGILRLLHRTHDSQDKIPIFRAAISFYEKLTIPYSQLIAEKNVTQLACRYKNIKNNVNHEELFLLNPGATFVHALFANNANVEDIMYYFGKLTLLPNEMIANYLALSDATGVSITALLLQKNTGGIYRGIYDMLKAKFPAIFPAGMVIAIPAGVDTHIASVHKSVDESICRIAKKYIKDKSILKEENSRKVSIERIPGDELSQEVGRLIMKLKQELLGVIEDDASVDAFLAPIFSASEKTEDRRKAKEKVIFQFRTALHVLGELIAGQRFGNRYTIDPNDVLECGLTIKEIVALGYLCLLDESPDAWQNHEQKNQHVLYFVENLYIGMRGYNIDRHGDEEWRTRGKEPDDNKCPGGLVNQIVSGLHDHCLVNIKVVNAEIMLPSLHSILPVVLRKLWEQEGKTGMIKKWLQQNIMSEELKDAIVSTILQDISSGDDARLKEFRQEFSDDEIKLIGAQALRNLDGKSFMKFFTGDKYSTALRLEDMMYNFVRDDANGWVLFLEKEYKKSPGAVEEFLNPKVSSALDLEQRGKHDFLFFNILCSENNFPTEHPGDAKASLQTLSKFSKKLISLYLDTNTDEQKDRLFWRACEEGAVNMMEILLNKGANVNAVDSMLSDDTALMFASRNGHANVVEKLLAAGADVNAAASDGYTALMFASRNGHADVVEKLLAAGANVNAAGVLGVTALLSASVHGHANVVEKLLAAGADVNAAVSDGYTALIFASSNGYADVVEKLLAAGADVNVVDSAGNTAQMIAQKRGYGDIAELIANHRPTTSSCPRY